MKLSKRLKRTHINKAMTPREQAEHVYHVFENLKQSKHLSGPLHRAPVGQSTSSSTGLPDITHVDHQQIVQNYKNRILEMAKRSHAISNAVESTILVAIRTLPPHLVNALQLELRRHIAEQPVESVLEVA